MSLQSKYDIRYTIANLRERAESAVMNDVANITNEDPGTPDHANRMAWAQWANTNSGVATTYFMWPLGMNASIQASVDADPTGLSVTDNDIQFVVDGALPGVITTCVQNPPAGFNPPAV
jgi:hypothetical protein